MFRAPLPFYITSFRIAAFRETAEKPVSSINDVMAELLPPIAVTSAEPSPWIEGDEYRRRHGHGIPICDAQGA
jgi:hypothetical protein